MSIRKHSTGIITSSIVLFLIISSILEAQTSKVYSIVVMPFYEMEQYPYVMDQIRESLMFELTTKKYNVIEDDSTWAVILEMDYPLYFLNDEMAKSISQEIDVDLIVFGNYQNYSTSRLGGISQNKSVVKPILVKIYDKNKDAIILHERINFNQEWGLNSRRFTLSDFANSIVNKMKSLGY